jgi:hypothetical protein
MRVFIDVEIEELERAEWNDLLKVANTFETVDAVTSPRIFEARTTISHDSNQHFISIRLP